MLNVDGSEILDINAGGVIMFVTRDTLTQIKGSGLEDLFRGRWDKSLLRDDDGRVFLDINPRCFGVVVDYLNGHKIAPPDCSLEMLDLGEEDDTVHQKLMLAFGLGDNNIVQSKRFNQKHKFGKRLQD